jgi:lantibiotic leader peptide-processing serine protease
MKRMLLICALTALSLTASAFAEGKKYIIVLHTQSMIPASVEKAIQDAGGTITVRVPEIGALGVESANANFLATMQANKTVEAISEDIQYQMIPTPAQMNLQAASAVEAPGPDSQTGPDPLYNPYQWDKKRIRASTQGSYALQTGRPDVVVAVLDTGAQVLPNPHPDIAPHLDFARSRSFVAPAPPGGDPAPSAWDDKNGHGSHTMSNVGAPINAIGMVGVAPNVTLVSLKVLNDAGAGSYLWLAQALVYAGVNKFDVASMSLGGYIPHTTDQIEIKIVQRAVNFARENGVTPVAALGNDNYDVSDGHFMEYYMEVPGEIDGVIGVSATDYFNNKASYSNYGVGKTDVSAPGGDLNGPAPHFGLVLGAWAPDSTTLPGSTYALAAGTSMACPNAAGVCALIISQYGDFTPGGNGRKTHMSPQQVESILQQTANNQPCPSATTCDGGDGYSNYFGKGVVDALKAVTK